MPNPTPHSSHSIPHIKRLRAQAARQKVSRESASELERILRPSGTPSLDRLKAHVASEELRRAHAAQLVHSQKRLEQLAVVRAFVQALGQVLAERVPYLPILADGHTDKELPADIAEAAALTLGDLARHGKFSSLGVSAGSELAVAITKVIQGQLKLAAHIGVDPWSILGTAMREHRHPAPTRQANAV